jgi:diketogulonate reductase-like aldo/keto reductase
MQLSQIKYHSGLLMPTLGLGTFQLQGSLATHTILKAYEIGYRLIDTATNYNNHLDIALAIKKLPRDLLRIGSKISKNDIEMYGATKTCEMILSQLQTSYLDILYLHHPKIGLLADIMPQMVALKEKGLIRSIGISNFSRIHMLEIEDFLSFIDVNQIEVHPLLSQPSLYEFCHSHNIKIMAYRPFADNRLAMNKTLLGIANKYKKPWRQIVLRWLLQSNMQVICKASSLQHLQENFSIFDFELSQEDKISLTNLNQNIFTCTSEYIDYSDLN